jgi:NAD+ diphosphatase
MDLRRVMTRLSALDAELAATARGMFLWHDSHGFCARCGQPSQPCKGGWQRQCPACGAPHFPRSDPVVIMLVTHGNKALLGRSPGWPEGMFSLLAGFVEPGETLENAVRREVFEETGIHVEKPRYLASQPWPFPASLMVGMAAEALDEIITLDPVELEDARWVSREEMAAALAGRVPGFLQARRGAIARDLIERWVAGDYGLSL